MPLRCKEICHYCVSRIIDFIPELLQDIMVLPYIGVAGTLGVLVGAQLVWGNYKKQKSITTTIKVFYSFMWLVQRSLCAILTVICVHVPGLCR